MKDDRSELIGCVWFGEPDEVREVMHRLLDLPEFGMHDYLDRMRKMFDLAAEAEDRAKKCRAEARRIAEKLVLACRKNWTPEQMHAATGYDNPEGS